MADALTKSGDLKGKHLAGLDAVKLGAIREVFLDLNTGQTEFIIIEVGGLLGGSGKFHPVPWSAIRYDRISGNFQAGWSKDEFKASPSYDRDQLADPSYGWQEQSERFFKAR